MQFARKKRRAPFINIISLVDILVVLLIFYIATTVFKKSQPNIKISVPTSTIATTTNDTPPTILYVDATDKMYLGTDKTPIDPDKLGALLKSKKDADPNFKLALKADTKMSFGALNKIWGAAKFAGITDLSAFADIAKSAAGGSPP